MAKNQYSYDDSNDLMKFVPHEEEEVKQILRKLNEPITTFGEDKLRRRERLVDLIAKNESQRNQFMKIVGYDGDVEMDTDGIERPETDGGDENDDEEEEEFFTEGPEMLFDVRKQIADFSLRRTKERLLKQKEAAEKCASEEGFIEVLKSRREYNTKMKAMKLFGSQVVSSRYTSAVRYSTDADSKYVAAASWDGNTYIMNSETLETTGVLVGHDDKIGGLDWMSFQDNQSHNIASAGNEGYVNLYFDIETQMQQQAAGNQETKKLKMQPSSQLKGHTNRVTKVQFHPSNRLVTSASFDLTWRLWDIEKGIELYYQEGHSNELFAISNHPDGSLLASGGLDAIGRVWDLRTGKSIVTLEDHIKGIYAMTWRKNGYELITGGADNMIKVWDLRKSSKPKENIINHNGLISDLRISTDDNLLISSSYDKSVNLYSCDNWISLKKLTNNEKQMSCDINMKGDKVISGGWDRCVKLYTI